MDEFFKNRMFTTHAVAAAASVTLGTALTYPLDTIKTLIQVGSGSTKQLTPAQAVERVRALSGGLGGLYSGFGWLTPGRTFGLGARFGVYEILTAFCKDGQEDNQKGFLMNSCSMLCKERTWHRQIEVGDYSCEVPKCLQLDLPEKEMDVCSTSEFF